MQSDHHMARMGVEEAPTAEVDVLDRHEFGEATGGYTECMCGWPTREQWEAGEHPVIHIIAELCEAGVLTRVISPEVTP